MQTKINQANISAPIVINQAKGSVTATLAKNKADMQAYFDVTKTEAVQYADMKDALGFKNDE
jgi:flagellar assembly factor FliW